MEEKKRKKDGEEIQKVHRKKRPEGVTEGKTQERRKKRPEGITEEKPQERRRKRPEGVTEGKAEERRKRPKGVTEEKAQERRRKRPEGVTEEKPQERREKCPEDVLQQDKDAAKKRKVPHRGRRRKRKKNKITVAGIISKIILIVALAVFAYSAYQLFEIYYGYHKGETEYEDIEKNAISIDNGEDECYRVDFEALKEINPDVVAWIRFDEPAIINYPVVQGKDNSEYLSKTFKGYDNTVGSIFVNVDNNPDFSDKNTIIYGHHMNNGTMFNELDKYEDEEFWKKYPCFYIYTPDGAQLKYHIYSAGIVKDTAENYTCQFSDDASFQSFLDITKASSFYDTGVEPDVTSKVVTLSTCTKANNDERLVIHGMLSEVKK